MGASVTSWLSNHLPLPVLALCAVGLAYFACATVVGLYSFATMCVRMRRLPQSERSALFWVGLVAVAAGLAWPALFMHLPELPWDD